MPLRMLLVWLGVLGTSLGASAANDWRHAVLLEPDRVDAIYFQVLSSRDATHSEFVLAEPAVEFLPENSAAKEAAIRSVAVRLDDSKVSSQPARFVQTTERLKLSFDRAVRFGQAPGGSLLLLVRLQSTPPGDEFECHLLRPESSHFEDVLSHFGLSPDQLRVGDSGLDTVCGKSSSRPSVALQKFLPEFDRLHSLGFVATQRSGSTGIGYTLESLLGIEENNLQVGDFYGMELKAHRDSEFKSNSSRRMNLFLKEPQWIDGLSHRSRVPKYGYVDDNGRLALYSTVTSRENSHGLSARVDRERERVWLQFRGEPVAYWSFETLGGRLAEKLNETAFVGATTRGTGKTEEFHYNSVLYCRDPSVQPFVDLLERREVVIEMRMHLKPDGAARNHGTAFRVHQNRIPQLYAITVQCRSAVKTSPND